LRRSDEWTADIVHSCSSRRVAPAARTGRGRYIADARRSGIQPGEATAQHFDEKVAAFHVDPVDVGDLEFAARRGLERCRDIDDIVVVEIQPGHRDIGFWLERLLLDGNSASVTVEFDDAILLRRGDGVTEHGSFLAAHRGL
jgi:hypothetical protein